jgi:hypothetical protein
MDAIDELPAAKMNDMERSAWPQDSLQFAQYRIAGFEMGKGVEDKNMIERLIRERKASSFALDQQPGKIALFSPWRAIAQPPSAFIQHSKGEIQSDRRAARPRRPLQPGENSPGATPDFQQALARLEVQPGEPFMEKIGLRVILA